MKVGKKVAKKLAARTQGYDEGQNNISRSNAKRAKEWTRPGSRNPKKS